ncbi:MAG: hypothetical protein WBL25_17065 [Anaerolineales bacterium]
MSTHRNLYLLLSGLALIAVSLACGLGAGGAAPEAAAPEMTAPVEPEEPAQEEPLPEFLPTESILFPTALPPSISGLKTPTPHIDLPPDGVFPTQPAGQSVQPAVPESRRLTLEFPPVMRTGDSVRIRLQLEVDDRGGITPTAVVEGNVVTGEMIEIPNLYETHNVIAEARLDMAGMEVQPPGVISESLFPGQPVTFFWSVRPEDSGRYEGTAWLHLRAVPKGGGEETRIPVSIQFLEIEAKSFLGFLRGGTARGIGVLGSLIGSILGFPFVDDFAKWLWGRLRRR